MACLNGVLVFLAAAIMVQASDDQAAPLPSAAALKQDPKVQLQKINCEIAVSRTSVATENLGGQLLKDKDFLGKLQAGLDKAKAGFRKAERDASLDESVQFGARFLQLKQELRSLQARDREDTKHKIFMTESLEKIPVLEKELKTTTSEHALLVKQMKSMKRAMVANSEELAIEKKKIAAHKKEFPIKREMLEQEYAKPVIRVKTEIAQVKTKQLDFRKGNQELEKATAPLAKGLKDYAVKETLLESESKNIKNEVKATQQKTVSTAKANKVTEVELEERLSRGRDKAADTFKNSKPVGDKASAAEADEEQLQLQKLKAEEKGEAQVEEEEKEDDGESTAMKVVKQEHVQLTADLKRITESANERQAAAAEAAAKELATVKASYAKKLEIVRKSHEEALAAKATKAAKASDATDKTGGMEAKLQAAIPTLDP